jgi:hypothetical protein
VISVALIADSGPALEAMTRSLTALPGVDIVRHCHGHTPLGAGLKRCAPDLVLLDEMHWPRLALQRLDEIHGVLPQARAVVRATAGPETLGLVLQEVLSDRRESQPSPLAA